MNQQQVAVLLALANGHDQRHGLDDVKVQAWYSLFQQTCPDLDPGFAAEKVNEHYARTTDMLMPAHIVQAWKSRKQYLRDRDAIPSGPGVPMPEWFKDQVKGIRRV